LAALVAEEAAWIAAALFAVHPLASEAVLFAVGRAEIAALALGAVAFGLFATLDRGGRLPGARLALPIPAFLAAPFFKESAASRLAIGAAWVALRPPAESPPARALALRATGHVAALGVFLAARVAAVGWGPHEVPLVDNPLAGAPGATRVANAVLL